VVILAMVQGGPDGIFGDHPATRFDLSGVDFRKVANVWRLATFRRKNEGVNSGQL